jgi:hypothetical protein
VQGPVTVADGGTWVSVLSRCSRMVAVTPSQSAGAQLRDAGVGADTATLPLVGSAGVADSEVLAKEQKAHAGHGGTRADAHGRMAQAANRNGRRWHTDGMAQAENRNGRRWRRRWRCAGQAAMAYRRRWRRRRTETGGDGTPTAWRRRRTETGGDGAGGGGAQARRRWHTGGWRWRRRGTETGGDGAGGEQKRATMARATSRRRWRKPGLHTDGMAQAKVQMTVTHGPVDCHVDQRLWHCHVDHRKQATIGSTPRRCHVPYASNRCELSSK